LYCDLISLDQNLANTSSWHQT